MTNIIYKLLTEAGFTVYEDLPASCDYPFAVLEEPVETEQMSKGGSYGIATLRIHIWSNEPRKRGTMRENLIKVKQVCKSAENGKEFTLTGLSSRVDTDDTTGTRLLHGVVTASYLI